MFLHFSSGATSLLKSLQRQPWRFSQIVLLYLKHLTTREAYFHYCLQGNLNQARRIDPAQRTSKLQTPIQGRRDSRNGL